MDNQVIKGGAFEGRQDTDFAGGTLPFEVRVPDSNWNKPEYLPTNEKQHGRFANTDRLNCVTQSNHNSHELQLNQMIADKTMPVGHINFLQEDGYLDENSKVNVSEKFNANLNGTADYKGNWLYKVAQDSRVNGLIPQSMLPENPDESWDEYYNKDQITQAMIDQGKKFLEWFEFTYEWINDTSVENLVKELQHTPIQIVIPNHAIVEIKSKEELMDYYDSYDPFIKEKAQSRVTSYMKLIIKPIIKEPELAKVLKDADGKAVGVCVLARNPEELEAMMIEAGFQVHKKEDGSLDWDKNIQGDYKLR